MNAIELLLEQLKSAHGVLEMTMQDVTDESAHFNKTGKALSVAAAYAHAVLMEDVLVTGMFQKKAPLSASEETGASEPVPSMDEWEKHEEWARNLRIDLPKMKEFAQKVYKATEDWISSLKEEDLEKEIEGPMGKQNLAWFISNFIILHAANLTGEISAAKGFQGLKGYPF